MIKKTFSLLLFLLLLAGCSPAPASPPATSEPPATVSAPTEVPTAPVTEPATEPPTEPATEPPTQAPTEAPTLPPHSQLYIPDLSAEDLILYFNEVCLDAEINNAGDPSFLQKWISPISYHLYGSPTPEDLETLNDFCQWLNSIEGFPGICRTDDPTEANLRIHFCDQQELINQMGENFYGMDGAVTFWYMDDVIYDAIICIRTDLDQHLRNSVILEELYNGLGPIQDTFLRPDSIIYSDFSQPQALTDVDKLILQLLYHPELKCGMDAATCEDLIRQLYY